MARTTYTEINHRLTDGTAKSEVVYSMDDLLEYSNFDEIKDDDSVPDNIMSGERNHNILDGSLKLIPDDPTKLDWGAWTNSKTDKNGDFAINPPLIGTFANPHTSSGITLAFAGDAHPNQVLIEWYSGLTELASETFTIGSMIYFADLTVENYDGVIMTFIGTSLPRRHIKIAEIDYGEVKVWSKDGIIYANILEEINLTSSEITINTLDFSIHDDAQEFNMLNPEGVYVALQQKQKLTVREYLNGSPVNMGKFFLDTWKNTSAVIAEFTAYDAMGYLDGIPYKTSPMWSNATGEAVLDHIFAAAGWTEYTIDPDVAAELLSGYIPITSIKGALHEACLALMSSCIPNRSGTIEVKRLPSAEATNPIEKSQKFGSPEITQSALVNSVAVTGYKFTAAAATSQIYSAALAVGSHEIELRQPATGLSITGGTITASGINYAIINVAAPGTVTITGYLYTAQASVHTYEASGLTVASRSQKTVKDVYLVSESSALKLAQFLYEDYQRRIVQEFSMAVEDEAPGDNVDVDTMLGARKTGVITRLDIDLTGGFVADVEVRG